MTQGHPAQRTATGTTYEWPFELFIPGDQPESFRGCSRCSIAYRLEASTMIDGFPDKLQTIIPIRVIRSPPISCYELMDPVSSQGSWTGGVEYCISLRHRAIALGGLLPMEARLVVTEPGVEVTAARVYLSESHKVDDKCDATRTKYYGVRRSGDWPLTLDKSSGSIQFWQESLQLPLSVRMCSHSFDVRGITISHTLHFAATIRDGSGTETEVSHCQNYLESL